MRYLLLFVTWLIGATCSAQTSWTQESRVKPHNAEQELQARELQGGDVQMGRRRITILSNVQISASDTVVADNKTIAHVAGQAIRRHTSDAIAVHSPYVGAAYQHDTQDVGLITKEVSIRFHSHGVPLTYQKWGVKELIPNSGIYILTVADLKHWSRAMRQLQSDPQVLSVQARIVTTERQAK